MTIYLRKEFEERWTGLDPFEQVKLLQGKVFRELEARRTLQFESAGKSYFAKIHGGIGWKEIIANLLRFRLPVLGAENEWLAIRRLEKAEVPTMTVAAYGKRGKNPAQQLSFIITDDLTNTISLEDYTLDWLKHPPSYAIKYQLIKKVAEYTKKMHLSGVNHRDYYICHYLLHLPEDGSELTVDTIKLNLIDLHRAQVRSKTPTRWIKKDLAALYFSVLDIGLTYRDVLRFIRYYTGVPLRQALKNQRYWQSITHKAKKMYLRKQRKGDAI
ncbi:lipopolysaccharide core heptose(I) kinase RfaP [Zooshikella ganghwensis]|uniref:lipopolysaccharide core heptose(I) kinase RfaP n=1 Tax=Zooshikella ganghwensis TaxID=202772 RepID=UPI0004007B78|nr:lipopolysaccharide core heptose(I) kinase RfaP [Zooshikella ganghwensis]